MKTKLRLNKYEKEIVRCLYSYGWAMNINEISRYSKIPYPTVKKYVPQLLNKKIILKKIINGKINYYLNY